MDNTIFEETDNYISSMLGAEHASLQAITRSIELSGMPQISVSANQGRFLQCMALACGATRILELGTLAGYSTVWMAGALPAGGRLITLEADAAYAALAQENITAAGFKNQVEIRQGKAIDTLSQMISNHEPAFDFIFIDADKPPYTEYLELCLKLSHKGTVIVADNVIRNGMVLDASHTDDKVQGVQRFNKALGQCTQVRASIIQTVGAKEYDGMAIAVVL